MTVSAIHLTCDLIRRSHERGRLLTNTSVQRLAYLCHGWHWALLDEPLVDEAFEPWNLGPLLLSAHGRLDYFLFDIPPRHPFIAKRAKEASFDTASDNIIERVLDVFGRCSDEELVALCRAENGPWADAWNSRSAKMDDQKVREYFRSLGALEEWRCHGCH